jgi:hypothetical protein
MSDLMNDPVELEVNEFDELKKRAAQLGIKVHPSISIDKLRIRVNAAIKGEPAPQEQDDEVEEETTPTNSKIKFVPETEVEQRIRLRNEALRLVRVNVTCFDPVKKGWEGEFFTFENSVIGSVTKFVAYDTSEGYHVPQCILSMLEEKKYQHHYMTKEDGKEVKRTKLVKAYGIEKLPTLTDEELKALAAKQALTKEA